MFTNLSQLIFYLTISSNFQKTCTISYFTNNYTLIRIIVIQTLMKASVIQPYQLNTHSETAKLELQLFKPHLSPN